MSGGTFDPTSLPTRPGLYINFVEAAIAQITGGPRGTVAIPLFNYGQADSDKFFTIETENDALEAFGVDNIDPIRLALQGGAKDVLVYTVPELGAEETEEEQFIKLRDEFETRHFNVFVYPSEVSSIEQDATKTWVERNRNEGKHFFYIVGGTADEDSDPSVGNERSVRLADDYVINLITGVEVNDSTYSSGQYAPYIAGLVAGTRINQSITYAQVPVEDVTKRLKHSEIEEALNSGSLVLVHDGRKVKVEQGITTNSTEGKKGKIRAQSSRQAVATDIPATASDHYIGKLDNNADGQAALISAITAYLENLENNNVLTDIEVGLDPQRESVGDSVFLVISYTEIDSMERIFITINV